MRAVAGDDAARARRPQGTRAGDRGARGLGSPTGTISTIIDTGKTLSDVAQTADEPDARAGAAGVRFGRERRRRPALRRLPLRGATTSLLDDSSSASATRAAAGASAPAIRLLSHETGPLRPDDRRAASRTPRTRSRWPRTSRSSRSTTSRAGRSTCRCRSAPRAAATGSGAGRSFSTRTSAQRCGSRFPASTRPTSPASRGTRSTTAARVGFAIGYRYVFFAFELTLAGMSGTWRRHDGA